MSFTKEGFEIVENFTERSYFNDIDRETRQFNFESKRGGIRNAEKRFNSIQTLLATGILQKKAEAYLKDKASFVRAILFNKTPESNWLVTWHQDRTISVSDKMHIDGWGRWTIKDGSYHVQPTADVLNQMVTFRIHIDEATRENGCLNIIPNSHNQSIMSPNQIDSYVKRSNPIACIANKNSALVMRPHILHSSNKATKPSNRRVLHLEFCSYMLPQGLQWA